MGFEAGLGMPTKLGRPAYYIAKTGGNTWNANTYCSISFDNSGSMADIITPLTNALTGPYFSSGSAAGEDGIKSTISLRAELQDLYATGGIEGAPDYNTNSATNGADQYNLHVMGANTSEASVQDFGLMYYRTGGSPTGTPQLTSNFSDTNFITPDHFVRIVVCNGSQIGYTNSESYGSNWDTSLISDDFRLHISKLRARLLHPFSSGGNETVNGFGDGGGGAGTMTKSFSIRFRADGNKPSWTGIYISPGYSPGDDGDMGMTPDQELYINGVIGATGKYAVDGHTVGHTYNLADISDMDAWNSKTNSIEAVVLSNKSAVTDQQYWRNILVTAINNNITF